MMKVYKEATYSEEELQKVLIARDATKQYVLDSIYDGVGDNEGQFPYIYSALHGEFSDEEAVENIWDDVKQYAKDYVYEYLIQLGTDIDYDVSEDVSDLIENDADGYWEYVNRQYKDYYDQEVAAQEKEASDWEDEITSYYWGSRM